MNSIEFKKIVGEVLKQEGFKYTNKHYCFENDELTVFVAFQKSNFENSFYINYGFFIKDLHEKLGKLSHGFGDFGGRFIYDDNGKMLGDYKLSNLTKEALSKSILDNSEKFIKPAFEKGLDGYLEMYPAETYQKLVKSEEFWEIIYTFSESRQAKVLDILAKYEVLSEASLGVKGVNGLSKVIKGLGDSVNNLTKPVKGAIETLAKKSKLYKILDKISYVKIGGKLVNVITFADLAITGVSAGLQEYGESGNAGKAVASGAISTIESIGPLEGMVIGGTIASVVPGIGTSLGAVAGFLIGGVNWLSRIANPDWYDNLEDGVHDLIGGDPINYDSTEVVVKGELA